jgi:hypothetical protein
MQRSKKRAVAALAPDLERVVASSSGASDATEANADSDDCGLPVSLAEREELLCKQRRAPPEKLARPPAAPPARGDSLLHAQATATPDECYSCEEHALNAFQQLHSICSTEATASSTLKLLGDLVGKQVVKTVELEKIPKTHDDAFLRPPRKHVGERACVCGSRCLGRVIAKMRYGPGSDRAVTLTEFLTPAQQKTFERGGGLPARRGKCLLCIRYLTNYLYITARLDPGFLENAASFDLQLFENCVALDGENLSEDVRASIAATPHGASVVSAQHGYRPSACLFVDESFCDTAAGRGALATLAWRPVVRFRSTDYDYVDGVDGEVRIVQRGLGVDHVDETRGSTSFVGPLAEKREAARGAPKSRKRCA